jgi:hypothetical protein
MSTISKKKMERKMHYVGKVGFHKHAINVRVQNQNCLGAINIPN